MKNILPILILLSFFFCTTQAQNKPSAYDSRWQQVDSLYNQAGLPQSALAAVNKIYEMAKREKNDAQKLKALIYKVNLQQNGREDNQLASIAEWSKEIPTATEPARSIMQNMLATLYWQYFQNHRWQLYNRTATVGYIKTDIATWGADDFHKTISELYVASLQPEQLLQVTAIAAFEPIVIKGNVRHLRPTLFDLLAFQALTYFESNERDLSQPANNFELEDPYVFADAREFVNHRFNSPDPNALQFQALLLYQRLFRFHLNDTKPDALIDADIARLQFANRYGVMENKEDLYNRALTLLSERYGDNPAAAQAWYLRAQILTDQASKYNPLKTDTTGKNGYVQAKAICERVLAQKDSSLGQTECSHLLRTILRPEVSMETERVNMPGQPFRTLIHWHNVSKVYLKIVKFDRALQDKMGNAYRNDYWDRLAQLPSVREFSQTLPETGDYHPHQAEIKIEALPVGEYAMIASTSADLKPGNYPLSVQYFSVSAIAWINNGQDYFVMDRSSGQPLNGATVQVYNIVYNNKTSQNQLQKAEQYTTDNNGHFQLKDQKRDNSYSRQLEITYKDDHIFEVNQEALPYFYTPDDNSIISKAKFEKDNLRTFFFTDRAIYRPGQTVYFKGIVLTRDADSKQSKILSSFPTKVFLIDANEGKVDSIPVTTGDFGSYHGSFKLPENTLNGNFRIEDDSTGNSQQFSVEEYKRPKFYVEYDKLKGSYKVGDSVTIKGTAKAYSGNNIDGANVKYRVYRTARFPYRWLFWRGEFPGSNSQEITHGEIKTGVDGSFNITFKAIPDRTVSKELEPVFDYSITADVTDINGETRSGSTVAQVGFKAITLSINLPSITTDPSIRMPADSLTSVLVKAANLAGEPEQVPVTISIYALKAPERLIRQRYWQQPDQYVMSEADYLNTFPLDEYRNETDVTGWKRLDLVAERMDSSGQIPINRGEKAIAMRQGGKINNQRLLPGWYAIEARTTDKYGGEVKDVKYVELYDGSTGNPVSPQYSWSTSGNLTAQPGDKVRVQSGTSAASVFVIRKVERASDNQEETTGKYNYYTLNKDSRTAELSITEADRGGIGLRDIFIRDNRIHTRDYTVNVPWTNKELSIKYTSFRDKTLPGSGEKYSVQITGSKAEKVTAEVLAAMYDASLDQFRMQGWETPDLYPTYTQYGTWRYTSSFISNTSNQRYWNWGPMKTYVQVYDQILPFGNYQRVMLRGRHFAAGAAPAAPSVSMQGQDEVVVTGMGVRRPVSNVVMGYTQSKVAPAEQMDQRMIADSVAMSVEEKASPDQFPVQVRSNFNETAFFFPDLKTDASGTVSFSFTMPESLTKWKLMTLAYTRDLAFAYDEKSVITQKQLMVQPNAPRFLREGDRMELSTKIVNLTDSEMTGQVELTLTDPTTGKTADGLFSNRQPNQYFTVGAHQSVAVSFPLDVPYQYNRPLTYRIVAKARSYGDGEEATLPVVSNRMLVTESLPLNMKGDGTRNFKFEKLLASGSSETLSNHALTVEFTSNPAWYAVQALPYLMEYPYECAEQTFNRFYANALASMIANSSPRIKAIFEKWKTSDTAALLSNLQKNAELKAILLEETPWVLQAKSEAQQKKNIALLFDMVKLSKELESTLNKLKDMQSPNGGFVWFKGGPDNRYMTQYILTGIGHLQKLHAIPASVQDKIKSIVDLAIPYLDVKIKEDYAEVLRTSASTAKKPIFPPIRPIDALPIDYLYMRSFFPDYGIPGNVLPAVSYYRKQVQKDWVSQSKYMQGMIALALYRTGDVQTARNITASLKENAIRSEEPGMYWKGYEGGYYWYQAPIETQALLIEAFREISPNADIDRDTKTWLLRQKQTRNWTTTRSTADACYALLLGGSDWLTAEREITIRLGDKTASWNDPNASSEAGSSSGTEAGTGYFKKVFDGPFVNPGMGNITVTMKTETTSGSALNVTSASNAGSATGLPAWGAAYWQYFDNLDRITPTGGQQAALTLKKQLFIERNTDRGPVLEPVIENATLHVGDKIKVRIEIKADRDFEYVHMKDMRASCMEPVNVLSQYKWQGGLGYYESTKDASTNFFFDWIPRGTYVFEYALFVNQTGNFSNGVTSIQCMYAPEFSYHSEGVRVNVEAQNP